MKTSRLVAALFLASFTTACGPSLRSMQELARAGQVQPDAPLHARGSVTIAAPRDRVWSVLTDVSGWPAWQPNVKRVAPPASLDPGASFVWVNGKSEIHSTLEAVHPNEWLAWTGTVSTAKAIHIWRFSSPTPDTTRVDVEETMDGFLLTWFYGQKDLDAEMKRSLDNLRAACEAAR